MFGYTSPERGWDFCRHHPFDTPRCKSRMVQVPGRRGALASTGWPPSRRGRGSACAGWLGDVKRTQERVNRLDPNILYVHTYLDSCFYAYLHTCLYFDMHISISICVYVYFSIIYICLSKSRKGGRRVLCVQWVAPANCRRMNSSNSTSSLHRVYIGFTPNWHRFTYGALRRLWSRAKYSSKQRAVSAKLDENLMKLIRRNFADTPRLTHHPVKAEGLAEFIWIYQNFSEFIRIFQNLDIIWNSVEICEEEKKKNEYISRFTWISKKHLFGNLRNFEISWNSKNFWNFRNDRNFRNFWKLRLFVFSIKLNGFVMGTGLPFPFGTGGTVVLHTHTSAGEKPPKQKLLGKFDGRELQRSHSPRSSSLCGSFPADKARQVRTSKFD